MVGKWGGISETVSLMFFNPFVTNLYYNKIDQQYTVNILQSLSNLSFMYGLPLRPLFSWQVIHHYTVPNFDILATACEVKILVF